MRILPISILLFSGCSTPPQSSDPFQELDSRHARLMNSLGIANRDTTRNIHNKEAHTRQILREQERVAFFRDPEFSQVIKLAESSNDPTLVRKADAYEREAVFHRSWTKEEKARETILLSQIQSNRQREASWTSPSGDFDISLNGSWRRVAGQATELPAELLPELSKAWVDVRTNWIGPELEELIRLRNEVARREGFDSYWELALHHRGLSPDEVDSIMADLERVVLPLNKEAQARIREAGEASNMESSFAYEHLLRKQAGLSPTDSGLSTWFDADLAEARVSEAFTGLGLSTDGIQVYSGPSRYTRPGAYSYALRPPEHVAIVLSSDHRWSTWQYSALAHEMGLATWWRNLPIEAAKTPVFWQPPTPWFEGVGQFFERIILEPQFAADHIPEFPAELLGELRTQRIQSSVREITRYISCTKLEKELYLRPGEWSALSEESAQREKEIAGRSWDAPVASNGLVYAEAFQSGLMLHFPAYIQNFLFATTTEAVLWQTLEEKFGVITGNEEIGPWMVNELIHPVSTEVSFPDRLSQLSSEPDRSAAVGRYLKQ